MAYTLEGRKCGTVRFENRTVGTVQKETTTMSSKGTSVPMEDGSDINDHVTIDPQKFSVNGIIIDAAQGRDTLEAMWKGRDIIKYTGRSRIENLVITNLTFTADKSNAKGFSFTASLQQVQISTSAQAETGSYPPMAQQDASKPKSYPASQTSQTRSDGLKTTVSETISSSAYAEYVNSFNSKPSSSSGPLERSTPSYSGLS